jgi:hypothetical protein
MDCQTARGGGGAGWKRGGPDGENMVRTECSASPSPNSMVTTDSDNHYPTPSRGGDARFQHRSPGLAPMQDNRRGGYDLLPFKSFYGPSY